MRESSSQYFVGLDIGTSAVRCVIGTYDHASDNPAISVVGYGSSPNSGLRKGVIMHLDDVVGAIHEALTEAERISGIHVENVTVNINGPHVSSLDSKGVIAISTASKQITYEDRMRVQEAATIVQLPSNREIIQVFPKNYQVDGHDSIKDPVGMQGVRLEAETHIITAATPNLRSLDLALEKSNVYPSSHTVSGLAAAEMVLSRKQREAGAAVIDIGASTTNIAVIEDGEIQHVAVIPIGGINITNDLAIGLKVDLEIAEKVKLEHAALAGEGKNGRVSVEHEKRNHVFESDDVRMIVEARVEEIFEYVDKELKKIQRSQKLPGGVVLVGGSAKIPGIAEFAKEQLELPAKIGNLDNVAGITDDIQDLSFIVAVGLMHLDMIFAGQTFEHNAGSGKTTDVVGSALRSWWAKIKP
ncbi:MAG TPA: cell division protein FtsA [Candidatus Saccharimonadales bacterium]|nr:cell division protein FtsA [Candidatus Saccharimonadales bacterium]